MSEVNNLLAHIQRASAVQKKMFANETGFAEIRQRGRNRFEIPLPISISRHPMLSTINHSVMVPLFGSQVQLLHSGCFIAMPDSDNQNMHTDGPHKSQTVHLPPYLVNLFIPLVDLTAENGPTEFRPGTHRLSVADTDVAPISALLKAGCALIFDYRLEHRGLGNKTTEPRPVLYFTFGSEVDSWNFKFPFLLSSISSKRRRKRRRRA